MVGVAEDPSRGAACGELRRVPGQELPCLVQVLRRHAAAQAVRGDVPLPAGVAEQPVTALVQGQEEGVLVVEDDRAVPRGGRDVHVQGHDLLHAQPERCECLRPRRVVEPGPGGQDHPAGGDLVARAEAERDVVRAGSRGGHPYALPEGGVRAHGAGQPGGEGGHVGVLAAVGRPRRLAVGHGDPACGDRARGGAQPGGGKVGGVECGLRVRVGDHRHPEWVDGYVGLGRAQLLVPVLAVRGHPSDVLGGAAGEVQSG